MAVSTISSPAAITVSGSVLQAVSVNNTTQVEGSFASATDLMSASITPTRSSSKILVLVAANGLGNRGSDWDGWLVRGSTTLGGFGNYLAFGANNVGYWGASICLLDSPATTSSITYKLQGRRRDGSSNCIFNVTNGTIVGTVSTITLLEIAA